MTEEVTVPIFASNEDAGYTSQCQFRPQLSRDHPTPGLEAIGAHLQAPCTSAVISKSRDEGTAVSAISEHVHGVPSGRSFDPLQDVLQPGSDPWNPLLAVDDAASQYAFWGDKPSTLVFLDRFTQRRLTARTMEKIRLDPQISALDQATCIKMKDACASSASDSAYYSSASRASGATNMTFELTCNSVDDSSISERITTEARESTAFEASESELNYKRRFTCDVSHCTRADGFSSLRDLHRHKLSVHLIAPSAGPCMVYCCALCETEGVSNKIWPRRDNLKVHLMRKHALQGPEHLLQVLKQSECRLSKEMISQAAASIDVKPHIEATVQSAVPGSSQPARGTSQIPSHATRPGAASSIVSLSDGHGADFAKDSEADRQPTRDTIHPSNTDQGHTSSADQDVPLQQEADVGHSRTHHSHPTERPGRRNHDGGGGGGDDDDEAGREPQPPTKRRKFSSSEDAQESGVFPCVDATGNHLNTKGCKKWTTMYYACRHHKSHDWHTCWTCFKDGFASWKQLIAHRKQRSDCQPMCLDPECINFEKPADLQDRSCDCGSTSWEQWSKLFRMRFPNISVPESAQAAAMQERQQVRQRHRTVSRRRTTQTPGPSVVRNAAPSMTVTTPSTSPFFGTATTDDVPNPLQAHILKEDALHPIASSSNTSQPTLLTTPEDQHPSGSSKTSASRGSESTNAALRVISEKLLEATKKNEALCQKNEAMSQTKEALCLTNETLRQENEALCSLIGVLWRRLSRLEDHLCDWRATAVGTTTFKQVNTLAQNVITTWKDQHPEDAGLEDVNDMSITGGFWQSHG